MTDLGGNKVDLNFHTPNLLLPSVDLDGGSRNYSWIAEASLANVVKGISLDNDSSQATVNILGGATSKLKSVTVTLEGIKDGTKEVLVLGEETVITGKINHGGINYDCILDLFEKNSEMVIAHDPSVLHESGIDGHPSLVCHKHIANSIINKI